MAIKYGAKVLDVDGEELGTVDHLMQNPLTGEVTKFMVRRKARERDLFISSDHVKHSTDNEVELDISLRELISG